MALCNQADCGGSIAPDGYCDTCGVPGSQAPAAAPTPPAPAQPAPPQPSPAPTPAAAALPHAQTGASCTRPDCEGHVASDGYCDTCGLSPQPAPAAPAATAPSTTAPPVPTIGAGHSCTRSDCEGHVADDGYCDTCGLAPISAAAASARSQVSAPTGATMDLPSIAAPEAPGTSKRLQSGGSGSTTRRTTQSRRSGSVRARLGAGLVRIEPTTIGDPSQAVMSAEKIQRVLGEVPEDERNCAACGRAVGRGADGKGGRVKGFCGNCRTPFDFVTNAPVLQEGDLVAGQYEILGPLAHGGMGWIYLGRDRAVSGRWVVLKGLLNSNDPDAAASAVAERQFLAQIEHANIVNIYNFVRSGGAGYIVMEFVGGQSLNSKLKDRRKANHGVPDPLPPTEAISYMLGILPALGYLHDLGLVYNDMKPANVMVSGDDVKLIDVGAVMRMDDNQAAIFGTAGFQAPEVASMGPSVSSDLYTVGRTLAVLMLNFVFHTGAYEFTIPPAPLFAQNESLYRFLLKSTAQHPDDRFQDAEEMTEQLLGVLREVVAMGGGPARPTQSTLFGSDRLTGLLLDDDSVSVTGADSRVLPMPRIDPEDQAAGFLNDLQDAAPQRAMELIQAGLQSGQIVETREVLFRLSRAMLEVNSSPEPLLARIEAQDPWEWRVDWYRGLAAFYRRDPMQAAQHFNEVWTELPGEIAPRMAVALAAEQAGEFERAAQLYQTVVTMDSTFVSAAFGLARCRASAGDADGAVTAYRQIPPSSATYVDAQIASARALALHQTPTPQQLEEAATTVQRLQLDAKEEAVLKTEILEKGLIGLQTGTLKSGGGAKLFGEPLQEESLREVLEDVYRAQARMSSTSEERYALIDKANAVRPRSLI